MTSSAFSTKTLPSTSNSQNPQEKLFAPEKTRQIEPAELKEENIRLDSQQIE